jgi:spore coat protein CotH
MYIWIKRNGTDMGLFSFVEQVDEEFLGRHGFDASGALYKAINVPATLSPTVNTRLYRKLLRKDEPYTDLIDFTANINIANPHRFAYVADEVNLPNYINVMAAMAVPSNHDQLTKNYYLYRDPHRQEWFRLPWDGDAALHNRINENWTSPLYGDAQHTQELRNNAPNRSGRTTCTVPFSITRSHARCTCAGCERWPTATSRSRNNVPLL